MKKNLHDIDDLFKRAIDGHREEVPPFIWENINTDLDKRSTVLLQQKYYRLKRLAIALIIFGFAVSVYAVLNRKPNRNVTFKNATEREQSGSANTPAHTTIRGKAVESDPSVKDTTSLSNRNDLKRSPAQNNTSLPSVPETVTGNVAGAPFYKKESSEGTVMHKEKRGKGNSKITHSDHAFTKKNTQRMAVSNDKQQNFDGPEMLPNESVPLPDRTFFLDYKLMNLLTDSLYLRQAARVMGVKGMDRFSDAAIGAPGLSKTNKVKGTPAYLTLFFSPEKSTSRFQENERFAGPGRRNRDDVKREEEQATSFSSGILLNYPMNNAWSLQSGAVFTSSSTRIAPKTIYAQPDTRGNVRYEYNCSAGNSYITTKNGNAPAAGDSVNTSGSTSNLQYIVIPLAVNYSLGRGKLTFTAGTGLSVNFLVNGKVQTTIINGSMKENSVNSISGLRSTYFNGLLSFGADYKLGNTLSLNLTPTAKFALSPINKNTSLQSYQNFFGLSAGLRIKL